MGRILDENGLPLYEDEGFELREFKPQVIETSELGLTELILADTQTVWRSLPIPGVNGHCVDLGYDSLGKLVGVKVWAPVATSGQLDELRAKLKQQ